MKLPMVAAACESGKALVSNIAIPLLRRRAEVLEIKNWKQLNLGDACLLAEVRVFHLREQEVPDGIWQSPRLTKTGFCHVLKRIILGLQQ
jgi:hypothetical protein